MSRSRSLRRLLPVASLAFALVLTGCGGGTDNNKKTTPTPPADLSIKVITPGTGTTVASGDTVTVDYQGSVFATGKVFDQSYDKTPDPKTGLTATKFPTTGVVPGFEAALVGQKVGTQLIVSIPSKYGYGDQGNPQINVSGTDTLVFVIEIKATAPTQLNCTYKPGAASNSVRVTGKFGTAAKPIFTKPLKSPKVQRSILKAGKGGTAINGDIASVLETVYNARTGKKLNAQAGQLQVGGQQSEALFGPGINCIKQGSRVVTTIPVSSIPGAAGNGLKKTDSIIIVTDLKKIDPPQIPATKDWTDAPAVTFNGKNPPTVAFGK